MSFFHKMTQARRNDTRAYRDSVFRDDSLFLVIPFLQNSLGATTTFFKKVDCLATTRGAKRAADRRAAFMVKYNIFRLRPEMRNLPQLLTSIQEIIL
jgi:hypothetical protein